MKEYIYILDFSDCTICEIVHDAEDDRDIEDVFKDYGLNIDTCQWMISPSQINKIVELQKEDISSDNEDW